MRPPLSEPRCGALAPARSFRRRRESTALLAGRVLLVEPVLAAPARQSSRRAVVLRVVVGEPRGLLALALERQRSARRPVPLSLRRVRQAAPLQGDCERVKDSRAPAPVRVATAPPATAASGATAPRSIEGCGLALQRRLDSSKGIVALRETQSRLEPRGQSTTPLATDLRSVDQRLGPLAPKRFLDLRQPFLDLGAERLQREELVGRSARHHALDMPNRIFCFRETSGDARRQLMEGTVGHEAFSAGQGFLSLDEPCIDAGCRRPGASRPFRRRSPASISPRASRDHLRWRPARSARCGIAHCVHPMRSRTASRERMEWVRGSCVPAQGGLPGLVRGDTSPRFSYPRKKRSKASRQMLDRSLFRWARSRTS